ncbi:MAG TPA: M48 family metalloprotease, partial [Silvibacterium sp.]|nr:M48 family metalloprotease [Silvibacterium sp.]
MPTHSLNHFSRIIPTLAIAALAVSAAGAQTASPSAPPAPAATTQSTPAPATTTPAAAQPTATPAQNPAQTPAQNSAQQSTPPATTAPAANPAPSTTDATSNPAPASDDQTMPGVKKGSIEDVNAVGDRTIGARGPGNWYSVETEIKMGKQYAMEVEKSSHIITDPVIAEYVNRIGQNIVKNSDCKVPFTIKVIDTDEINAMALPGGFFYVNSGLILAADEEAELAGVMAHEIAHVCAHHAAREMTRANYAQIGMVPLIMMTGYSWTGYGIYEATQLLIPITFLEFSREFEAQADYLGVQYMFRAGYDPQAFVTFFEKVQNLE